MHPRNVHQNGYPMDLLCKTYPALKHHVKTATSGKKSIDFSQPEAVLSLNAALLAHYYGVDNWRIPDGYLCPPVPGRADYIHSIADLIDAQYGKTGSTKRQLTGLDIGTGANLIYPILGSQTYGWNFIASDIDPVSVKSAKQLLKHNKKLNSLVEVRQQVNKNHYFKGVVDTNEKYAFSMCNPPFHKSIKDATEGSQRKLKGLDRNRQKRGARQHAGHSLGSKLNFAGQANELWCTGGELAFIQGMITESVNYKGQIDWFTCLVSKSAHLKPIEKSVHYYEATQFLIIDMYQGQKQSRCVAWTFL